MFHRGQFHAEPIYARETSFAKIAAKTQRDHEANIWRERKRVKNPLKQGLKYVFTECVLLIRIDE